MSAFLLSGTTLAYAAPVQLFSGDTIIEYDLDNFFLNVDGFSHDPSVFSITPVTNGVRLGFGRYLNLYASSYFSYSPENKIADYSALFPSRQLPVTTSPISISPIRAATPSKHPTLLEQAALVCQLASLMVAGLFLSPATSQAWRCQR